MRPIFLAFVFVAACGGDTFITNVELPPATAIDMMTVMSGGDMFSTGEDMAQAGDLYVVVDDMAQPMADMSTPPTEDMAVPPADLTTACAVVPPCNTSGSGPLCCNGATCVNGSCLSTKGQPCNTNTGPLCYTGDGSFCGADGICH